MPQTNSEHGKMGIKFQQISTYAKVTGTSRVSGSGRKHRGVEMQRLQFFTAQCVVAIKKRRDPRQFPKVVVKDGAERVVIVKKKNLHGVAEK